MTRLVVAIMVMAIAVVMVKKTTITIDHDNGNHYDEDAHAFLRLNAGSTNSAPAHNIQRRRLLQASGTPSEGSAHGGAFTCLAVIMVLMHDYGDGNAGNRHPDDHEDGLHDERASHHTHPPPHVRRRRRAITSPYSTWCVRSYMIGTS